MVEVGEKAPDFTMPSDEGRRVTLSQELGKGPVVLSWYVFDFTGVCTSQMCALRDGFEGYTKHGAKVFGVSTDSAASHKAFRAMHNIPFPLLSDWNKTVSRAYGVLYAKLGDYEGVSKRSVFVLDREGTVRYKWVTEDPKVPPDPKIVEREVAKLVTSQA